MNWKDSNLSKRYKAILIIEELQRRRKVHLLQKENQRTSLKIKLFSMKALILII